MLVRKAPVTSSQSYGLPSVPAGTVLPLLNSTLVGGPRSTGALNSNRRRVSNDLSIRYDRLLGCPAEKPRSVTPSPSMLLLCSSLAFHLPQVYIRPPSTHLYQSSSPKPGRVYPESVCRRLSPRLHRNIKSRPQLPTTEKRRIHLEHFRRVYWQTRDERETATTSRCSEAPSSPCPVIKRDEADEFNDPLIAWSNGLDIDKLLESPRLSTMAQFG